MVMAQSRTQPLFCREIIAARRRLFPGDYSLSRNVREATGESDEEDRKDFGLAAYAWLAFFVSLFSACREASLMYFSKTPSLCQV